MMNVLKSYLVQHKSISIPGLGTLYTERIPAQTDFLNKQILAPSYKYKFDKYFDAPDKAFFTFLAAETNMPDFEAIKLYNEFAYDIKNNLRIHDHAVWQGVGVFKKDDKGEIVFETNKDELLTLSPVVAERVVHENAEHAILVGDMEKTNVEMTEMLNDVFVEKESWWIYAIILAAIALCILFYYSSSTTATAMFGNQSTL